MISTTPYMIRAIYEWCMDQHFTPYMLVDTSCEGVVVPTHLIQNDSIVLNLLPTAVRNLDLGDEWIMFDARFSGSSMEVIVPIAAVRAIFSRENGMGCGFDSEALPQVQVEKETTTNIAHSKPFAVVKKPAKPTSLSKPEKSAKPKKNKPQAVSNLGNQKSTPNEEPLDDEPNGNVKEVPQKPAQRKGRPAAKSGTKPRTNSRAKSKTTKKRASRKPAASQSLASQSLASKAAINKPVTTEDQESPSTQKEAKPKVAFKKAPKQSKANSEQEQPEAKGKASHLKLVD